ncbi:YggT family protein [Agromyces sp. SYSU T0242]|uniref:YggT family protein n=1 Tax=Agromyces litoreus TaxID=3158561 RepID=UPI0033994EEB
MSRAETSTDTEWKPPWYLRVLQVGVWILYIWVLIGVIALLLRVFLLLFAANPDAGFAAFVYRVSDAYLHPFRDIFPTRDLGDGGYLDISAIFAIIVYALIAGGVGAAVAAIGRRIERAERRHRQEMDRLMTARAQGVGTTPSSGAQAIVGGYIPAQRAPGYVPAQPPPGYPGAPTSSPPEPGAAPGQGGYPPPGEPTAPR